MMAKPIATISLGLCTVPGCLALPSAPVADHHENRL